jgi:1-deoxy-D-xylulose-5-phosphate synthase
MKPFVAIYSTFLQRSYDQIIHDVALQRLPVRFMLDRAGLVGEDGPTHHGAFDMSYLRIVPGMVIMTPADGAELERMLDLALEYDEGPIAVRFPRGTVPREALPGETGPIEIGKGALLRKGGDAALVAVGSMVTTALEAADLLARKGMDVAVVNARFVKPIDRELILSAASGDVPIVTLEENALNGGFGDAVAELIEDEGLSNSIARIGLPDEFIPHGKRVELLAESGLTAERVAERLAGILEDRSNADIGGVT